MALGKGQQGVQRDAQGRVTQVKLDKHVLDPTSPDAVQIPEDTIPGRTDDPDAPSIRTDYDDVNDADF